MRSIKIQMTVMLLMLATTLWAQSAYDYIVRNRNFSASNYSVYPDSIGHQQTPPPADKHPFYLSHYGRHGSRYLNNRTGYDTPYRMLCKADSMGQLTALGKSVKQLLQQIISDSEERWGDLSDIGKQQLRHIASRMIENYPEIFKGQSNVQVRSTTVNRCVMSMGTTVQQLIAINPQLHIDMNASKRDSWYLNYQDAQLRDSMKSMTATRAYDAFTKPREENPRLMEMLFTHPESLDKSISERWLNYYLLKTALIQQNTHTEFSTLLIDLFSDEDIYRFWLIENAWWYIQHGGSLLNGGHQPYTQRYLLRKIIAEADSCIHLKNPGAQLRFGHETVMLPLACLLELRITNYEVHSPQVGIRNSEFKKGFDFQTRNLEDLEPNGWWAGLIFPMASNFQFVFYRKDKSDNDVIFKVLLNEQEVTLPIESDIAPYYHWRDFRRYYLRKLDDYEKERLQRHTLTKDQRNSQ